MSRYKKEIRFTLNNIDGEFKLIYTLLSSKLYLNDVLLPKKNFFTTTYFVETRDGSIQKLKISQGIDFIYKAKLNESVTYLEVRHTLFEYTMSVFPIFILFRGGIVGILLGILGSYLNLRLMRLDDRQYVQFFAALCVTVVCFAIFYILSFTASCILKV